METGKFDIYPGKGIGAAISIPGENMTDTRFDDIICTPSLPIIHDEQDVKC